MIRFSRGLLAGVFLLGCLSKAVLADEHRWTHYGVRPLGMGNAFVAVADDFNALFYNPAGLARLESWDGEFLNPTLAVSQATTSFISDLTSLAGGSADSSAKVLEILQNQTGKVHHGGFNISPHLVFPGFGFGVAVDFSALMVTHSSIDIELDAGPTIIAPIAFAMNFLEDRLSVGAGVKIVAEGGVNRSFNIETLSAFSNSNDSTGEKSNQLDDFIEGGFGVGLDFGLLYTPIKTMAPTIGLSVTDSGGTPFEKFDIGGSATKAPDIRLASVNTGVSLKPYEEGPNYLLVAIDAHGINQPHHYSHKVNLGLEYGIGSLLKLQAGLKAGYLTAGTQLDVGLLNVRLATYVEDHGEVVGLHQDLVDRRFLLSFKLLI